MLNEIATELYRRVTQSDLVRQSILDSRNGQKSSDSLLLPNPYTENLYRINADDPDWMIPPPNLSYKLG